MPFAKGGFGSSAGLVHESCWSNPMQMTGQVECNWGGASPSNYPALTAMPLNDMVTVLISLFFLLALPCLDRSSMYRSYPPIAASFWLVRSCTRHGCMYGVRRTALGLRCASCLSIQSAEYPQLVKSGAAGSSCGVGAVLAGPAEHLQHLTA